MSNMQTCRALQKDMQTYHGFQNLQTYKNAPTYLGFNNKASMPGFLNKNTCKRTRFSQTMRANVRGTTESGNREGGPGIARESQSGLLENSAMIGTDFRRSRTPEGKHRRPPDSPENRRWPRAKICNDWYRLSRRRESRYQSLQTFAGGHTTSSCFHLRHPRYPSDAAPRIESPSPWNSFANAMAVAMPAYPPMLLWLLPR